MAKQSYIALDCEFHWDQDLHQAHRAMDQKSKRRAVAVKKVMAAAAFQFSIDDEGRISTGEVASWNEFDWGDEEAVVAQLFDYLRAHEGKPIVTFGGLATDIPVLLLAGLAYGLRLPPQMLDQPGRRGPRPHLDLGLMLKGGGRTWSHLSQVLLRMGVPFNLVAAKPGVRRPVSADAWQDLRDHVELDCLLLSVAKLGWLVAQGTDGLRLEPAIIGLIEGFLRRRPEHSLANELRTYADQLHRQIADGYDHVA
ncbi:conserved hypothetical protein [Altererythrobacter sp. B11]|uniref:hypothetical protein n=1 Tax=Altererythrobacter sp. B11 TaxID=2060312 RepID=UPI000DC6DA24|nr:hypothetical protein [Altererythrobacter sp. B11]BBC72635.1 conserved hypothetical protein [Altererythrobacter sp. B11]